MIKSKPPRPKTAKGGDGGGGADGATDKQAKNSGGGAAAKKRRPSQKKKETADDGRGGGGGGGGGSSARKRSIGGVVLAPSSATAALHQEEHRRYYQRAPRLLPDIDGVRSLSASEVATDLKLLQASLAAFETKLHVHLPAGASAALGGGVYLHGNKAAPPTSAEDAFAFLQQKSGGARRLARPNGVITPEEVVESLPVCRRAVRITQRELAAMKRERDDLERDFMRLRCKLLWQMGEMKRIQKQHDRALQALSQDVVHKAKSLASSRRRTNALQDIMTELDARGSAVVRLTREKHQLETLLKKQGIALPEPDEIYIGDRVASPFGEGRVKGMDDVQRVITVELENGGGVAYVQEETVEVLPSEISYADTEKELKTKLFEKIGALVQPTGRFSFLAGGTSGRRRSRGDAADEDSDGEFINDVLDQADGDEDEEGEDEEDAVENGTDGDADEEHSGRRSMADGDVDAMQDDETRKRPAKKRKLMVPPSSANAKKKLKNGKVFDFTAGKIPITPYDVGLLLSPLSVLPERVAAVGPDALQWLSSYLPAKMADWEQDRYHALQMQGEIERLRFQLQKAEDDKEDAHTLAVEQVDSMNDLVRQIEKLREQVATKDGKEKDGTHACPNCNTPGSSASKKASSAASKQTKANGKAGSKTSTRRPRSESTEGDDDDTEGGSTPADKDVKKTSREESDGPEDSDSRKDDTHGHDEDDFGDDGGESSDTSKPAARSLRPRRGSGNSTTSQSSASTSNATSKASK